VRDGAALTLPDFRQPIRRNFVKTAHRAIAFASRFHLPSGRQRTCFRRRAGGTPRGKTKTCHWDEETHESCEVGAGAAFILDRIGNDWAQPARLFAADGKAEPVRGLPGKFRSDSFGSTVAISGDTVVVGAPDEGVWTQNAKLVADDGQDFDSFGLSVSVSGPTVLVGANDHTPASTGTAGAGSAYVFQQRDGQWVEIVELAASDGIPGGDFGTSVAVQNNTLVVGADLQHPPVEGYPGGEAYLFKLNPAVK